MLPVHKPHRIDQVKGITSRGSQLNLKFEEMGFRVRDRQKIERARATVRKRQTESFGSDSRWRYSGYKMYVR